MKNVMLLVSVILLLIMNVSALAQPVVDVASIHIDFHRVFIPTITSESSGPDLTFAPSTDPYFTFYSNSIDFTTAYSVSIR